LINIFSLTVIRLSKKYQAIWVYILAIILAMIIIIRPVNGIIIFAIPFLCGSNKNLVRLLQNVFSDYQNLIVASLVGVSIIMFIPLLWFFQNGSLILYTYGDETFNFMSSHVIDVLLSYRNGWLVYTPLAMLTFAGFYTVFKKSRLAALKLFAFLFIAVYIVGCWSVWWYGEAFGMRPMIEFYFMIAILLGFWLNNIWNKKIIFAISLLIITALTAFNLLQSWQFKRGILPAKHLNKETYWGNFMSTTLKAKVYLDIQQWKLIQTYSTDMETDPGWLNYASKSGELSFSGNLASKIDSSNIYSIGFRENISGYLGRKDYKIVVSAMTYVRQENTRAQLVIDFLDLNGNSKGYNTFFLREFLKKQKWTPVEFSANLPTGLLSKCSLAIYFWNPATDEELFVDDIRIEVWEANSN
jgi:hypothetical protein